MGVQQLRPRPHSPRRALGLIRVSKEREGMTSPDVQRHAIDAYAAANGITIVDYIEGIDESGSRSKSAWWQRLDQSIGRVESGEVDTLIVWKFSRAGRNRLRWAVALDRVDTLGGTILSATEPIETSTASGKFARGMLGEINAYQADLIGESWKETLERRVRDGLPATGRPRFGYHLDRSYTIDEKLAPIVSEMYARAIDGEGMASITRWLNSQGYRTRNGIEWQTIGLTRYLDRGFAAGYIWSKGTLHPGAHEAIIDSETWDAYIARRASTAKAPRGRVRMLSGLLRCGTCGGPMMTVRSTGGSSSYGCASRARGGTCEAPATITRSVAEAHLTGWIAGLTEHVAQLREADEKERALRATAIEDRAALARLIRRAEEKLSTLTLMLLDNRIPQAAYDSTAAQVNSELEGLKLRFARTAPRPASSLIDTVPRLVDSWADHDPETQNQIARSLVTRIVVTRGRGAGRMRIVPRWETT